LMKYMSIITVLQLYNFTIGTTYRVILDDLEKFINKNLYVYNINLNS